MPRMTPLRRRPTPEKHELSRFFRSLLKRELPVDCLEFFVLTPLPGSEDHQKLTRSGIAMERDMNKYDLEHVCTAHRHMTQEEWQSVYQRMVAVLQHGAHRDAAASRDCRRHRGQAAHA